MLFKKTLKVACATALWMVPLLGANSAMAQPQSTLPMYSAEAITVNAGNAARPRYGINNLADPGALLSGNVPLAPRAAYIIGLAGADDDQVYIRVAPTGVLQFEAAPELVIGTRAPGATTVDYTGSALASSPAAALSADGAGAYIFTMGSGSAVANAAGIQVRITRQTGANDAAVRGVGNGGVMVSVYRDREDANFGEGATDSSGSRDILSVRPSVTVNTASALPEAHTATATSRFTMLDGYATRTTPFEVSFGGFNIAVNGEHRAPDGMTLMQKAEDATDPVGLWAQTGINGSTRFYGDGGWAFAQGFRFAGEAPSATAVATCADSGPDGSDPGPQMGDGAGITSSPLSEEDPTDDVIGGIKEGPWVLCVTISNENEETIPAGVYNLDVNLAPRLGDTRPFPPNGKAGLTVAVIDHDGTTIQIPYVTSYDGYTQRIVIVNRNKVDVDYAITFHAEGDGEIMGDNPHEGMLMAGQATVLKVNELVTLTNPTRAAATLTVAAKPTTIDAATTMVNKMDQSTDTVVLD